MKTLRCTVAAVLMIAMFFGMLPTVPVSAAENTDAMGAVLDSYQDNTDTFTLSDSSRFFVVSDTEPTGELLQTVQLIQRQFAADSLPSGTPLAIVWGPESWIADGDIVIRVNSDFDIAAEGYELDVTAFALVCAADLNGLIYGLNRLHKHFRFAQSHSIQGFSAADAPDTRQRAVSLDCGRKYFSKNWICNFIREISWMGYNTLELHFSDDSGFRIDIWDEDYYTDSYQPANDFSWLCGSNYTSWTLSAYKNDPDSGKYLSAAELIEILETAKEYRIDVIPAYDSPSHLDYTTWMYEQNYKENPDYSFYSTYDQKTYYASDVGGCINYTNSSGWSTPLRWPYYSTINVKNAQAKAFIFEIYTDIADFFKTYANSTDFSIGADEVNLSTSNLASGYSFAWGFSDFVDYINELNAFLNNKGYTMRMYNDFLGSTAYNAAQYDFADNIEILYWDSPFEPTSGGQGTKTQPVDYYVNKGTVLYNCIQTNTYYALRITGSGSDARSLYNRQWTFYHSNEEDIYYEWYPADISEHGDYSEDAADVPEKNLGGAYFLIWCDYACVSTEQEIWNGCYDKTAQNTGEFYSLRDRMWSNITKMWNSDVDATLSFADFKTLRDSYGDCPGIGTSTNACSEAVVLPKATEPVSGYAGGCQDYAAYGVVRSTEWSQVMSLPCSSEVNSYSVNIDLVLPGIEYTVLRIVENTVGELWYKVCLESGVVGYLKATDTVYVRDLVDDIILTGAVAPSAHVAGRSFSVTGIVESRYNCLNQVAVYVHAGFGTSGNVATGYSDSVTGNYYSLAGSTIDDNTVFGQVPAGNHTYVIWAEYTSSHADGNELVIENARAYLMEHCFVAVSAATDQSGCTHNYSETVLREATCLTEGTIVFACSACGHVYEKSVGISGHDYQKQVLPATCLDYERVEYTCKVCTHTYTVYPEDIKTQWMTTKPEGIADSLIETMVVYRYSDYETIVSDQAVLDGYTQIGSDWVLTNQGKVAYVNSWPSGFQNTNSLYSQYNNKANKVTAYETDNTKRVVDSDKIAGYLYYHWCYRNSYYSIASSSGSYTTFHAYYSTTPPGYYTCDYSDYSYKTAHSSCSNSAWFFVANVYEQAYSDYSMQYTHGKWGEWSEWSETAYTATDNRKVEKQVLYRYVDGTLGDHAWDGGVCEVCGVTCSHCFRNNVCTECGEAKPVMDYYLFGYINGVDYADKADSANLGEYRFVAGSLVVFFTEDSYVGVKASDNENWYMTDGWQGYVSSVTLYNTKKLTTADKLFVPGGTEVTFILTDNGDDTYVLSYTALECPHENHSQEGVCTLCGDTVDHAYNSDGYCICGLECQHSMADGICTVCGKTCEHIYQNNICILCDGVKPVMDYYLFGYINGRNYACEEDYQNLGVYKFVDGKVVVRFDSDSYVAVKAADNLHWYMTQGWQGQVTSATLYNTQKLSNADKLFVPGGREVTFTLTDNGDDTYVLSYEAVCIHASHDQNGICSTCGESVRHTYQNNVCDICGLEKAVQDFYLFGYINGVDYADKADSDNLGIYRFTNGTLVAYFTQDSYVGVKTADNLHWYMTDGYQGAVSSSILYPAETILSDDKLFVPAGLVITFTLIDNGDDTYVLSYTSAACAHENHSLDGVCHVCGASVEHSYQDGICGCGKLCEHIYSQGICGICGHACQHIWSDGVCTVCGMICTHVWADGECSTCGFVCRHNWIDGVCSVCGIFCGHNWSEGFCADCGMICQHRYQNNVCTICGFAKPAIDYYLFGIIDGREYAYGSDAANLGTYRFENGVLTVVFRQDSFVGVKSSNNSGWYMAEREYDTTEAITLFNTTVIEDGVLLPVPGQKEISFHLQDNGDDTLTLGFAVADCRHPQHDVTGICLLCGGETGHNYSIAVTEPTCTEDGYTVFTCTGCQDTYTEVLVSTGHSYKDGVCENCGAEDPEYIPPAVPGISASNVSLRFEDEICINVYFTPTGLENAKSYGLLTFTGLDVEPCHENAVTVSEGFVYAGEYLSVSSLGIPAKKMGDMVYFSIYAELAEGSYFYSKVYYYSPTTYAYNMLNKSDTSDSLKALVVSMLNYGTAAQMHFNYNTANPVNSGLSEEQKAMVRSYEPDMIAPMHRTDPDKKGELFGNGNTGFGRRNPSVSFEGAFAINFYLEASYEVAGDVEFYIWDAEAYNNADVLLPENASVATVCELVNGQYRGVVNGIAAKDVDHTVYVAAVYTGTDGNTYVSGVMAYSLGTYIVNQAAGTSMPDLAQAAGVYAYYAKLHFMG